MKNKLLSSRVRLSLSVAFYAFPPDMENLTAFSSIYSLSAPRRNGIPFLPRGEPRMFPQLSPRTAEHAAYAGTFLRDSHNGFENLSVSPRCTPLFRLCPDARKYRFLPLWETRSPFSGALLFSLRPPRFLKEKTTNMLSPAFSGADFYLLNTGISRRRTYPRIRTSKGEMFLV